MKFTDCNIFIDGRFIFGDLTVDGDKFGAPVIKDDHEHAGSRYIIPGLVDIHTHGCMGYDFSDGDPKAMEPMARFYASHGVTSFCPTTMTLPYDVLEKAFRAVRDYASEQEAALHTETSDKTVSTKACGGDLQTAAALQKTSGHAAAARPLGINMEGPYFSVKKKGAQNEAYLKLPDYEGFKRLYDSCEGMISLVDIAPEIEGAHAFIQEASKLCTVSVAHTDADYDQAKDAFEAGADHLTHLYNAMPPIHHREPGVIGAASENKKVYAELICDGYHIHPSAVRMGFELFKDRICLVSDSLRCAGMPDGEYELGGQPVFLKGGVARLAAGNIAGSAADLFSCMKNAISFGIPKETAIAAATVNPAKSVRADNKAGSITAGRNADFVVCDDALDLEEVYIGGNKFR